MTINKRILGILLSTVMVLVMCGANRVYASENYDGGLAITSAGMNVYSDYNCTITKGALYDNEGITILYSFPDNKYLIQYSTASGTKEGYIQSNYLSVYTANTCVGVANYSSSVYAGNDTSSYTLIGSIDSGEIVAVLGIANNNWYYIEYNTASGRKRGFVPSNAITLYNAPNTWGESYLNNIGTQKYVGSLTVYSGPTYRYTVMGSVSYENIVSYGRFQNNSEDDIFFITYTVTSTGKLKSGFVFANLAS